MTKKKMEANDAIFFGHKYKFQSKAKKKLKHILNLIRN